MKTDYEVIIVGAGAAGIACGQRLAEAGIKFLILEARSRIGGRILSIASGSDFSIELGAEFIHGTPKYTLDWLSKLEKTFYDVKDTHHLLAGKKISEKSDFWAELQVFMEKLRPSRKKDETITDFLKSCPDLNPRIKPFFKAFVEGFHGANLDLMGVKALASTEETDDDELNGAKMFRPAGPYAGLIEGIFQSYKKTAKIKLAYDVKKISWQKRQIIVEGRALKGKRNFKFSSKHLVMTAPIGVLGTQHINWEPYPKELQTLLQSVTMGHVQRIIFKFKERFWEKLTEKPLAFLHAGPDFYFPTWWSFHPLRVPYLLAWQGGPKAEELAALSKDERIDLALSTLVRLTKKPKAYLLDQIEQVYTHNWSTDPFSRGAYSYILTNGMRGFQKARDIQGTIFFAGEGVAEGPSRGTVHGAFNSGVDAAERILKIRK